MAVIAPTELAEALAAVSPEERRAALDEAARLRGAACCDGEGLAEHLDGQIAQEVSVRAKALADPVRVQLFELLRRHRGEICQCEFQPLFDLSQPTLSHHLRKLVDAGLVEVERRGRWAYYWTSEAALEGLREWVS